MRIAVLGPLEVWTDDGVAVAVPGAKERLLLAVLAAGAPGVVSTDRIVEQLWNGDQPAAARKALQVHLVHLRTALEPDRPRGSMGRYVVRRGTGYALATEDVDAVQIADLAGRGRALLASGDPAEAERLLSTALDLWRGDPYGDWPDASFAESERRRLTEVRTGAVTALLEARLALGRSADVIAEAERLLTGDPLHEEWWRLLVLALYRAGRQGDALAAVGRARAVLVAELGAEPGPRLRAAEAAVLAQDPALDQPVPSPVTHPSRDVSVCPYKGLATYQSDDAALFHGRSRVVTRLVGRLVDAPLLVVSGASGAGKSSLVRAGLVPALAGGTLPGSAAWHVVLITPGRRPVDALAGLTGDQPPVAPVVLVCDQFEELWAPGIDPAERAAFMDAVLGLLDDAVVVRCVVVLRGDHVGRLAEHAAFTERLGAALVLVPALTEGELRDVVRGPAAAVGLTADTELLDTVVADVGGRPSALPLLSTALVGTWERRRGDRLTLAGYLEAGGVAGALSRAAEDAYAALDEPGRALARRLLVRLADIDDGGALVRRPALLAELALDGADGAGRRAVVDTFVDRRLLVVDGDSLDVAHEALLTAWPRLARWLEDDAVGRAVRRHLTPAALEWHRRGEPEEELYRGARLGAALDWAAGAPAEPTADERRFIDASRARADAELTEARERADREVAARRRTRRLAVGLAAVLVVALVAAGLTVRAQSAAEQASQAAERQSLVADANRLAAVSSTEGSLDLTFLLAAQGFRLAETPQTQDALLAALAEHRRAVRAVPFPGGLLGASLGNDGQTLYIGGGRRILTWAVPSGELPGIVLELSAEGWDGWHGIDASPTEPVAAAVGSDQDDQPWFRLVDADGSVRPVLTGDAVGGTPFDVSFTADGRLVDVLVATPTDGGAGSTWRLVQLDPADGTRYETGIAGTVPSAVDQLVADISTGVETALVWPSDGGASVEVVDLASGRHATLPPEAGDVGVDDYRALSSGAAQLWADGAVTLYDRTGRVAQQLDAHNETVSDVVLAPDGRWAATVGIGGAVVLWAVDPVTGLWSQRESLTGHGGDVLQAEVSPDSRRLFTMSRDTVIVWDVGPDGGFGESHPGIPGRWIASPPDVIEPGRLLVAPTRPLGPVVQEIPYLGEGTRTVAATFLDPRTGEVVEEVVLGETREDVYFGASVAVSPDRRWVAVTSGFATTVLDTRSREEIARIELPPDGYQDPNTGGRPAGTVWSAEWSSDGARLLLGVEGAHARASGEEDPPLGGDIVVVDTATWKTVDRVPLDVVPELMELGPGGRYLAAVSGNSPEVLILDATSLDVLHTLQFGIDDRLTDLDFSPDGRLMAGGGFFGAVHVADTRSWELREPVLIGDAPIQQVEWLRDSRTVVVTAVDGTVSVFDAERALVRAGTLSASPGGARGYTRLVPDPAREVVLLNDQHPALRYPMDPAVWLREACAVAGRDLTGDEWDQYLPGRDYEPTCSDLG